MWYLAPVEQKIEGWTRWQPLHADSAAWDDLAEAVEAFEPPCNPAGEECAEWLKEQALHDYPHTATWVLFKSGLIEGFFAISSGLLEISYPDSGQDGEVEKEKWPCSQIKWLCKRDRGKFHGRSMFMQAAFQASEVAKLQGNVALVIDPFDSKTAAVLERRHEFLRRSDQGQLWLPLYPEKELIQSRSG